MTDSLLADDVSTEIKIDPNKDYLAELVGEGKKFKTVQDLARGKYEADVMIASKNRQFDELTQDYLATKKELDAVPRLQELVDRLAKQPPAISEPPQAKDMDEKPATIDFDEIKNLAKTTYEELKTSEKEQANISEVRSKLAERFGENYKSVVRAQAQSLGLSKEMVDNLERTSPKAFFNVLGLNETKSETFQTPPRSVQRNDNFAPRTEKRGYSYYQNLRKTNPTEWLSAKTHNEMMARIAEVGEDAFYRS